MPFVLEYNRSAIESKFDRLGRYINISGGLDGIIDWVNNLKKEMNIPHSLQDMGVQLGDEEKLSKLAFEDPSTGGNPLPMTVDKFKELIKICILG